MATPPTSSAPRVHYAWVMLSVGTLVVMGALGLARFGYTVVLPPMQADIGLDNTQAGAIATANLLGYLTLSLIGGALASRFGPRKVVTAGLLLAAIGMSLTGVANGFLPILSWRAITGVGSGASNVPVMGLMAAWFASRKRGMAAGIAVAGSSLAIIAIGPLVPRLLAIFGNDGWRISWYLFGGSTFVLAFLAWRFLRDNPRELGLLPLGAGSLENQQVESPVGGRPGWASVYRSLPVWHLGLVYIAFGFSYIIYLTFFSKRLVTDAGYSARAAGDLFMLMGWVSLLCGLIWGAVSDWIGRKWALAIVYTIQACAFAIFALWTTRLGFSVSAVLFGLTAWSIPAIMAAACGDLLGSRLAPAALGFITLFFGVGQAVGPSVAGAMADAAGSFAPAYLLAAGVAVLGALGAILLPSSAQQRDPGTPILEGDSA